MRSWRLMLVVTLIAGCTDDGGGTTGPGVTSHVLSFDFATTDGGACVTGALADLDDTTPGPQYECSVSVFTMYGTAGQHETIAAPCNNTSDPTMSTNMPCWAIETDATACTMADHLRIVIVTNDAPAADTHVTAQCASP